MTITQLYRSDDFGAMRHEWEQFKVLWSMLVFNSYSVRYISCFLYKIKYFALAYFTNDKYTKVKISVKCVIVRNHRIPCGLKTVSKRCKG
jgi:hypothetical protein